MNFKKALKYFLYTLISLISAIILYFGFAYFLARIETEKEIIYANEEEIDIYIITNGVHTDIAFPVKTSHFDWSKEVKFCNTKSQDSTLQYLAMGWGDKGFYLETPTWADLKVSTAFKAAFGLSNTAMHTTFYKSFSENDKCKKIKISASQYLRLINYITDSFQKDENGHFMHIKTEAVYGKRDAFYEANGKYSIFYTCNTWANNSLKSCGQKACLWTPFDTGIFLIYNEMDK